MIGQRFVVLLLLMVITGCNSCGPTGPGNGYKSSGVITGLDFGDCKCCIGWKIKIDDKFNFNFTELPPGSSIDLTNTTFPAEVLLDWDSTDGPCSYNLIEITRIRRK